MTRRFYKTVETVAEEGGHGIRLDGRPLPTTSRRRLVLPTAALAAAIAAEWQAQGDKVEPLTMPLTRLANTGIDRVADDRPRYVEEILRHLQTDTLAYWSPAPADLAARQAAVWTPLLDWVGEQLGHRLAVTTGIVAQPQAPGLAMALAARLEPRSDLALAGLQTLVSATGSAVVALALEAGRLAPADAFQAAYLDELYQAEIWGADQEAEQRRQAIAEDLVQTTLFLQLLDGQ
ncbi:MAG: ATP12 family protein [Sneathiellaceae bacterium]